MAAARKSDDNSARARAEHARRAAVVYQSARQAAATYQPREAVRLLRQVLRLLDGVDEPEHLELRVRALVSLAFSEAEVLTFTAGEKHLQAAGELLARITEPLLRLDLDSLIRAQHAIMLFRIGRLPASLDVFGEALRRQELARDRGVRADAPMGRILMNRSVTYIAAGEPLLAARDLRRCVDIAEAGIAADPDDTTGLVVLAAKAHHALGSLAWRVGDIPLALRYQEEANARYRELSPSLLPKLRVDQAEILLTAGLAEEAARHLDEALPQLRRLRDFQNLAEAETFRAASAVIDGEYALARKYAGSARRRFLRRSNETWAAIAALTGLRAEAAGALERGRVPRALPGRALELAAELAERKLPDESSVARLLAVRLYLCRGEVAEAAHQLDRVPRPRRFTPVDHHMLRRLGRAELAVAHGDVPRALRQARSGLAELALVRDRMGGLELVSGTAVHGRELGELAVRLVLDSPRAAANRLFDWLERTRAQVYRYEPLPPLDSPVLTERVQEYRILTGELRRAQLTGTPTGPLSTRHAALQREVMRLGWRDGPWGRPRPTAGLAEVAHALADRVLVSYVVSGRDLAAVLVADGRARLVRLGPVAEVLAAARELHADLNALAPDSTPDPMVVVITDSARRRAEKLAAQLLRPWADVLGDRELVVVPTGALYAVAWGVLPGLRGRPVSVAPSATAWLGALRAGGSAGRPTALVGAPGLAAAVGEVGRLREHHPGARLLEGEAATVPAVLAALDGAGLAHLAAHGEHEPENALFSRLELADGPLFAHETVRLRRPPEHVVLAACELALSRIRAGDEALGFAGALLSAGVRTVTAAVTRVGDTAAAAAMTDYHRRLAEGAPPARALAEATADDPYRRPFITLGAGSTS